MISVYETTDAYKPIIIIKGDKVKIQGSAHSQQRYEPMLASEAVYSQIKPNSITLENYSKDDITELLFYLDKDSSDLTDVMLGLSRQFYERVVKNRKFITSTQFEQGMRSLDLTVATKVEILDNYVTGKPHFKVDGKSISFEELLIYIANTYVDQIVIA